MSKELLNGYRVIKDFPTYMINKDGVVRNINTRFILKTIRETSWYVVLRKDNYSHHRAIRRLLKETFPELKHK